jgi:hypothetical protein
LRVSYILVVNQKNLVILEFFRENIPPHFYGNFCHKSGYNNSYIWDYIHLFTFLHLFLFLPFFYIILLIFPYLDIFYLFTYFGISRIFSLIAITGNFSLVFLEQGSFPSYVKFTNDYLSFHLFTYLHLLPSLVFYSTSYIFIYFGYFLHFICNLFQSIIYHIM